MALGLPAERFVEARRIVAWYAKRWVIEEFHKALKSGTHVEKSELETAERLQALVAVVAVRLLNTKMLARTHPEQAVDVEAFGLEAVEILSARFGRTGRRLGIRKRLDRHCAAPWIFSPGMMGNPVG